MKTQSNNHSGLMNLVAGVLLAFGSTSALAYTDTQPFGGSLMTLGADFPAFHGPVVGTVLSASVRIGSEDLTPLGMGDEIGVVRIASLLTPDDYYFLGYLTPTDLGEYSESEFDLPGDLLHYLNEGLIVNVHADPLLNNNDDTSFRLHNSVLTADVRPTGPTHNTPDTGSTLVLLGAGLTLLGALRGKLS